MEKVSSKEKAKGLHAENNPSESKETFAKWGLFNKRIVHLLLIVIISLLAYSNTLNVPFQFDDAWVIVENPIIKDLQYFTEPSKAEGLETHLYNTFKSRYIGFLTFGLNYKLNGLDVTGYHIFNLLIHIINALLLYWFVILTFRTPYFKVSVISASVSNQPNQFNLSTFKPLNYLPLFIALLFVSHPIQTQAVTYIWQRVTSLATMFYLLSLVMYIKWRLLSYEYNPPIPPLVKGGEGGFLQSIKRSMLYPRTLSKCGGYAISLTSAVLAMKTKEIAFTLPVVITLYEFMFFDGKIKKRLLYLIPILLTMLIIPLSLTGIDKPVGDLIGDVSEVTKVQTEMSRWDYLFTQFRVIVTYIRLLFLPINQNLDYDYPIYNSFFDPNVFLSFLFLLSIFGLCIYLFYRSRHNPPTPPFRKGGMGGFESEGQGGIVSDPRVSTFDFRLISFGIFWFFITLSVESSIIPIVDVIFEHRLYLPSVGAFIAFSSAIFYVLRFKIHNSRRSLTTYYLLLTTIIIALSIATYQRNTVWNDEVTLWEDVVSKSPEKARGYNEVGLAYQNKGWLDKAIEHYQIALRLTPYDADIHNNLGITYNDKGLLDKAIEHYQVAIKLKPDNADFHYNIGIAYYNKGMVDKAIEHFQIALRLKPNNADFHNNLGITYKAKGLTDKAIEHFQIALNLKPDYAAVHFNIGKTYFELGFINKARNELEIVLQINPNDYQARQMLNSITQTQKLLRENDSRNHRD